MKIVLTSQTLSKGLKDSLWLLDYTLSIIEVGKYLKTFQTQVMIDHKLEESFLSAYIEYNVFTLFKI